MDIIKITLIGLFAGVVGTGLGSLISIVLFRPTDIMISSVLGFAGGIMISIVCFDLIPEALEIGGILYGIAGMLVGVVVMVLLDLLLPHAHFIEDNDYNKYVRTGILLGIGIAMHNLPEGLAIGAGYAHSSRLGFGLALLIALHNLPEGIAMAAPMYIGGVSPIKVIIASLMAGTPMGLGAYIGVKLGVISEPFLALSLGFAGGAMLYISFDELIPESHKMSRGHSATFSSVIGVIIGILMSIFI